MELLKRPHLPKSHAALSSGLVFSVRSRPSITDKNIHLDKFLLHGSRSASMVILKNSRTVEVHESIAANPYRWDLDGFEWRIENVLGHYQLLDDWFLSVCWADTYVLRRDFPRWMAAASDDTPLSEFLHDWEEIQAEDRDEKVDRKSTRLNSSHSGESRMPSSA